ncbi:MAG: hypothetical protein CO093_07540 [Alphaproteobacteria bacterium CG_4_9_14_3_um_filter_47_13]|nr:MAG: hypothetical protein CO093_07540 [Alphaproteobacteria bacterium CG_4_9_14_3_um_filter_47_13]
MACPSSRRFSAYARGAAAHVQASAKGRRGRFIAACKSPVTSGNAGDRFTFRQEEGAAMTLDISLIMILCAACTYLTFSKIQKKIWKILSFTGVWFMGFVLTILLGIYVSSELHGGDFSIMQRYLGNSIFMPLAGCVLGAWAFTKKAKAKKNIDVESAKISSSLIFLSCACALSLSACAAKGPVITPQDAAMNEALNVCGYTGTIDPKIHECAQNVYPQILPAYMQVAQQQGQQRRADARYDMQQASQAMSNTADAWRSVAQTPTMTDCRVHGYNNDKISCTSH